MTARRGEPTRACAASYEAARRATFQRWAPAGTTISPCWSITLATRAGSGGPPAASSAANARKHAGPIDASDSTGSVRVVAPRVDEAGAMSGR